MNNTIDEFRCPFCNKVNNCMAQSSCDCWCNQVEISSQLLAMIPAEQRNKACICKDCVNLFNQDPKAFKQQIL